MEQDTSQNNPTENTEKIKIRKIPKNPFQKGHTLSKGYGRPKGSRNAGTLIIEQIGEPAVQDLMHKMVALGKEGDVAAAKFILERFSCPRKGYFVEIPLPPVRTLEDVGKAMTIVIEQMAQAKLTVEEANAVMGVLEKKVNFIHAENMLPEFQKWKAFFESQYAAQESVKQLENNKE